MNIRKNAAFGVAFFFRVVTYHIHISPKSPFDKRGLCRHGSCPMVGATVAVAVAIQQAMK